jgi:hypothetical protein
MSGDRIDSIRSWRDQTRDVYGVDHERGDSDLVCNNKAWWRDADALLKVLDASSPRCETCRFWQPTTREPSKADIPGGRFCARLARDLYGDDPCDKAQVDWCGCCDTAAFFTAPDFGCVLHEPAGPSGEDQTKP